MTDPVQKGNKLPYCAGARETIIPDKSTQLAAFRTGQVDMMSWGVNLEDVQQLTAAEPRLMMGNWPAASISHIWPRLDKGLPWDDINVRIAANLAVNQQELVEDYYQGNAQLMGWPFLDIPAHKPFYTALEDMPQICQEIYGYHPDKAKQLLADAGYPDGFKTTIACVQAHTDMLAIIKEYLIEVGIDMELQVLEGSVFNGVNRGRTHDEMIYKETKMAAMPWHMFEVRDDNADGVAGEAGGRFSRLDYSTYYADLSIGGPLTLDDHIIGMGKLRWTEV